MRMYILHGTCILLWETRLILPRMDETTPTEILIKYTYFMEHAYMRVHVYVRGKSVLGFFFLYIISYIVSYP